MPNEFTVPDDPIPILPDPVPPIYERQATLGLHSPSVILVGAGGVGCWTALALVLGGVEDISIFDGDTLSTNNLNRFPLPEAMVGELKSVALAHWLSTLRPKATIIARGMFDPSLHSLEAAWVVCCTDSLKSRLLCHSYAKDHGSYYLEIGADGERWTLSPTPPEFSTELEAATGYNSVPVHVGPCMMAGAAAAYYVLHNCIPIVSHSTNWIKGPIIQAMPNLGALKFESMAEISYPLEGKEFFVCPECGIKIEQNLILIIKHWRQEHHPEMGLAEAKVWAEHQLAQLNALSDEDIAAIEEEEDIVRAEMAAREMEAADGQTEP